MLAHWMLRHCCLRVVMMPSSEQPAIGVSLGSTATQRGGVWQHDANMPGPCTETVCHPFLLHSAASHMQCCASVQGNFNKMAFIKKMLANTPRADAEWIWWTGGQTPFSMVACFLVFSHFLM